MSIRFVSCVRYSIATNHMHMAAPRKREGGTRVRRRLDGSCISRYPTNRILVAKLKSVPFIPRSFSSVPSRAWERLLGALVSARGKDCWKRMPYFRSKKFKKYIITRNGSRRRSTLRRRVRFIFWCHSGLFEAYRWYRGSCRIPMPPLSGLSSIWSAALTSIIWPVKCANST